MLHRVDVEQTPDCVTPEPSRIFRVHVPRRQFDPWSVLDGPAATDAPVFAWSDGRSGLRFAAVGEVASWDLDGADRFDVAGQLVSRLRELLCDADVPSDLPLVHAGFSFSGTAGAGPWDGWPAARICLPRVLAWGCEGRGGVVVAGHANGEEADAAVVDRLRHLAAVSLRCATGVAAAPPRAVDRVAVDRATWCRNVVAATDDIGRGALDKVVLARSAFVAAQSAAPPLLRALAAANVGAYAFCVGSPRLGYFLGATPETLARVERGSVETVALAGTCPRGATAAEDVALGRALAASGKDQREHAITTGAIRAALEPVCEELYVAATPSLVRSRKSPITWSTFVAAIPPASKVKLLSYSSRLVAAGVRVVRTAPAVSPSSNSKLYQS